MLSSLRPIDEDTTEHSGVTFTWSQCDRFAAIAFDICDSADPRGDIEEAGGYFDILYIFNADSQSLQEVTHTKEPASNAMCNVAFSPSGELLVVPWKMDLTESLCIEIYCTSRNELLTSSSLPLSLYTFQGLDVAAFSPDGLHFAVPECNGFRLFDAGTFRLLHHEVGLRHTKYLACISFSPDSTQLVRSHQSGRTIYGDTDTGPVVELFNIPAVGDAACSMIVGTTQDCASCQFGTTRQLFVSFNSLIVGAPNTVLFSTKPDSFGKSLQALHDVQALAVSADGIFLAAITRSQTAVSGTRKQSYALCIFGMADGRLLHTYRADGWINIDHRVFTSMSCPGP